MNDFLYLFEQFKQFCERQQVKSLTTEQSAQVDYDRLKWRYGQPGVED